MKGAITQDTSTEVLVTLFDMSLRNETLRIARILRDAALKTEIYFEADKLKKQLSYAAWHCAICAAAPRKCWHSTILFSILKSSSHGHRLLDVQLRSSRRPNQRYVKFVVWLLVHLLGLNARWNSFLFLP